MTTCFASRLMRPRQVDGIVANITVLWFLASIFSPLAASWKHWRVFDSPEESSIVLMVDFSQLWRIVESLVLNYDVVAGISLISVQLVPLNEFEEYRESLPPRC